MSALDEKSKTERTLKDLQKIQGDQQVFHPDVSLYNHIVSQIVHLDKCTVIYCVLHTFIAKCCFKLNTILIIMDFYTLICFYINITKH